MPTRNSFENIHETDPRHLEEDLRPEGLELYVQQIKETATSSFAITPTAATSKCWPPRCASCAIASSLPAFARPAQSDDLRLRPFAPHRPVVLQAAEMASDLPKRIG